MCVSGYSPALGEICIYSDQASSLLAQWQGAYVTSYRSPEALVASLALLPRECCASGQYLSALDCRLLVLPAWETVEMSTCVLSMENAHLGRNQESKRTK